MARADLGAQDLIRTELAPVAGRDSPRIHHVLSTIHPQVILIEMDSGSAILDGGVP